MTRKELLHRVQAEFRDGRRRFAPGVLIAFVRFLRELDCLGGRYADFDEFSSVYPVQSASRRGGKANTLIVSRGDAGTLSIRPFYNEVENYFRSTMKRFDYPNAAPHATQSWKDYLPWFDALLQMPVSESSRLESEAIKFVLEELPSHEFAPGAATPIRRRFSRLLEEFEFTAQTGEPRGGSFQGVVYAFIRADAPHLHLEVRKVGAGTKRLNRVGDVDGWQGEHLALSAEVKHYRVVAGNLDEFANFANAVARRGALGLIIGEAIDDEAREEIAGLGLRAVDLENIVDRVDIWDPLKQDAAVDAFAYYVHHVQQNTPLIVRLREFLSALDATAQAE